MIEEPSIRESMQSDSSTFDLIVIHEGDLDICTKKLVDFYNGAQIKHGGYGAFAKDWDELPNLELFAQTLRELEDVVEVEMRMTGRVGAISQEEVEDATEDLVFGGQFVLLEGNLNKKAEEWLMELNYVVKTVQGLVAIARIKEDLPEDNLMFAMYASYINVPIGDFAILIKKDD